MISGGQDHETRIQGYTIIKPLTENNPLLMYSRIILLVKDNVQVAELRNFMSNDISSIWVKVNKRGHKQVIIGRLYREQYLLKQPYKTNDQATQTARWSKYVKQWRGSKGHRVHSNW